MLHAERQRLPDQMTDELDDFFTDTMSDHNQIWTAGFLNERFPGPVSPLGWTLIRESLERLALRDPLRYVGVSWRQDRPLTRLYHGHPYTDAEAFWSLYKLFPDLILPDDAARYFPDGDISLRKQSPRPTSLWDPRVWWAVGQAALTDWGNWSPWHNWRNWRRFELDFSRELSTLGDRTKSLERTGVSVETTEVWAVLDEIQALNRRLLRRHRWSLTHADLTYTLLQRMLAHWTGGQKAGEWSALLVSGVPNLSLKVDSDLAKLAALQRESDPGFDRAWNDFLSRHGHRSFSLDIYHPPFAADPDTVRSLLRDIPHNPLEAGKRDKVWEETWAEIADRLPGITRQPKIALLRHLVHLTRIYMGLREDQRYRWQQALALMRQLVNVLGQHWAEENMLAQPDDIFFVTWEELAGGTQDRASLPGPATVCARRRRFEELRVEYITNPTSDYPAFLRGNEPWAGELSPPVPVLSGIFWGRAASPGRARGPVRRIADAGRLDQVPAGAVLVARSTDPGWTPVFSRIAALVTETGGLLSHGAVVAREYGLPAVVAVAGIFEEVEDGQLIEVDGAAGRVSILSNE